MLEAPNVRWDANQRLSDESSTEMRTASQIRETWRDGAAIVGPTCFVGSSVVTEVAAASGFDFVLIDLQHGLFDMENVVPMLQASLAHGAAPIVRVPTGDYGLGMIGRVLDAGAEGIVMPVVESPEAARRAVEASRYPLSGNRSYGPTRAAIVHGSRETSVLDEVLCLVQIETLEAYDNTDEIVATEGLDGVYIGPADLGLSLGKGAGALMSHGPQDEPEEIEAIRRACMDRGIVAGIACGSGSAASEHVKNGFQFITVGGDLPTLRQGFATLVSELRAGGGLTPSPSSAGIY